MRKKFHLLILVFALLAWAGFSDVPAQDISFVPSIRVDDDTTEQDKGCPTLAVDGDSGVYITRHDQRDTKG